MVSRRAGIIAWWLDGRVVMGRGLHECHGRRRERCARRGEGRRRAYVLPTATSSTHARRETNSWQGMEDSFADATAEETASAIPVAPPALPPEPDDRTLLDAIAVPLAALLALLALRQLGQLRPPLVAFSLAASGVAVALSAPHRWREVVAAAALGAIAHGGGASAPATRARRRSVREGHRDAAAQCAFEPERDAAEAEAVHELRVLFAADGAVLPPRYGDGEIASFLQAAKPRLSVAAACQAIEEDIRWRAARAARAPGAAAAASPAARGWSSRRAFDRFAETPRARGGRGGAPTPGAAGRGGGGEGVGSAERGVEARGPRRAARGRGGGRKGGRGGLRARSRRGIGGKGG